MQVSSPFQLAAYNTFGLHPLAQSGLILHEQAQLAELSQWYQTHPQTPILWIGEGSNLLFTEDFAGLAVINRLKGKVTLDNGDHWLIHVAAGENWHELVTWLLRNGMPGMENLAMIPGTVGAAPVQNIGAYGADLSCFCAYVDVIDLSSGEEQRYSADECRFGYRDSIFKHEMRHHYLITAVGFYLPKLWQPRLSYGPLRDLGENPTPQQVYDRVCELRTTKLPDPKKLGNAGSFFKNPLVPKNRVAILKASYPNMPVFPGNNTHDKLAAGWLIDQAGLKGYVQGPVGVHQEQALVIVNLGHAEASDILALAHAVVSQVYEQFDIQLEPEVRFIGTQGEIDSKEAIA